MTDPVNGAVDVKTQVDIGGEGPDGFIYQYQLENTSGETWNGTDWVSGNEWVPANIASQLWTSVAPQPLPEDGDTITVSARRSS